MNGIIKIFTILIAISVATFGFSSYVEGSSSNDDSFFEFLEKSYPNTDLENRFKENTKFDFDTKKTKDLSSYTASN